MNARKLFAFALIALLVLGTFAAAATYSLAAGEPVKGLSWIGEHKIGDLYPIRFQLNKTLRHSTTVAVTVLGLDLTNVSCINNWGNQVSVTGTSPNWTINVAATPKNDPNYVGLSANIDCGYAPVMQDGYGKIGFVPGTVTPNVVDAKLLANESFYQVFSGKIRMANIKVDPMATDVKFPILTGTKVTGLLGSMSLGECLNNTGVTNDCTLAVPGNLTFSETGLGNYIELTIEYADPANLPEPAVLIGIDVP